MKLYQFDEVDASLALLPVAARRALDAIGKRLSLEGFLSLPLESRQRLCEAGTGREVDGNLALKVIEKADPKAIPFEAAAEVEPDRHSVPADVRQILGAARPLPDKIWQGLTPLDRYAICKVARKSREARIDAAYREIVGGASVSTHLRPAGGVHMVSIVKKDVTQRHARAECWITLNESAFSHLMRSTAPKGDVLSTARLAGIMALKKTSELIPLCHPLALQHAEIDFEEHPDESKMRVLCSVAVEARTGVEMEAMVGANVAALTIYDMLKSLDRSMVVGPARLLEKSGGRSGVFKAEGEP